MPTSFDYEYLAEVPTDFYSWHISGAQQLPNGHLLINDGAHGTYFEIDENNNEVWRYINPVSKGGIVPQGQYAVDSEGKPINGVFRALRYSGIFQRFRVKH